MSASFSDARLRTEWHPFRMRADRPPISRGDLIVNDPAINFQAMCPFCASTKVVTNSKKQSPPPYSRCDDCGQVWHPERAPQIGGRRGVNR